MLHITLWITIAFLLAFGRTSCGMEGAKSSVKKKSTFAILASTLVLATIPETITIPTAPVHPPTSTTYIQRKRRPVHTIFEELGPYYVRRAYRMNQEDFWRLHRLLLPYFRG